MDARPTYAGIIPHLFIKDGKAVDAIDFYKAAFNAEEVSRNVGQDGKKLMHAHLRINGGDLFLCDEFPEYGMSARPMGGFNVHLQVEEVDSWWSRAAAASGMEVKMELADQFWGDRYGQLRDPFGVDWTLASPIKS